MAFKIVGVKVIVKNFSQFVNQTKVINKSINDLAKKTTDSFKKQGAASAGAEAATSTLTATLSKLGPVLAIAAFLFAGLVIQIKSTLFAIKVLTSPFRLLIKVVTSLGKALITKGIPALVTFSKWLGGRLVQATRVALSIIGKLATMLASTLVSAIRSAASALGGIFMSKINGVISILKSLASSAIDLAISGLGKLGSALISVAKIAAQGAATFQKLEIRFQGLVANEIAATDETMGFAESMELASARGAELLNWIQVLAITTPFTRRDISETVAFAMAMGFTSEKTKEMTLAIGNFVSGMGLSSDVMENIILQFGQMQAGGKLFGTELRDLARGAFVPVNEIIKKVAENLDMTASEWQDLAARGETDIKPFFEEFINMANTRFPGAMDRMNQTLEAAIQNVGEFVREFIGVKLLLPSINKISAAISGIFKEIATPTVMRSFELAGFSVEKLAASLVKLGKVLAQLVFGTKDFEQVAVNLAAGLAVVAEKVSSVVNSITDRMKGMGDDMKNIATDALTWGINIVARLAEGLIVGASKFLVQAMNFIGGLLTKWLAPGSAPLVAPDLTKWGISAVTEWLRGFTMADFGILKDIQSPLKSALDILVNRGTLAKESIGDMFASISTGLISGLAGGNIGSGVTSAIAGLAEFGPELNTLIQLELQLATATDKVREAEEALEQARRKFAQSTIKVREETMKYNRLLRGGAGDAELQTQLDILNATEEERNVAQEQIGIQEDNLQTAQDALGPLQEAVSLQKELINQLLELAKMQLDDEDGGLAGGLAGAMGGVEDAIEDVQDAMGALATEGIANLDGAFNKAKKKIEDAWSKLFDPIVDRWKKTVGPSLVTLGQTFLEFKTKYLDPILVALGLKDRGLTAPSAFEFRLIAIKLRVEELRDELKGAFKKALRFIYDKAIPFLIDKFEVLRVKLALFMFFTLNPLINSLKEQLGGAFKVLTETVIPDLIEKWDEMVAAFKRLAALLGFGSGDAEGGSFDLATAIEGLGNFIGTMMEKITAGLDSLSSFVWQMGILKDILSDMVNLNLVGLANTLSGLIVGTVVNLSTPTEKTTKRQKGAFRIPRNELALLHKNEMVIPAQIAEQVRAALTTVSAAPISSSRTSNVSFGDTHISNGMDMAMFQSGVERVLVGAL